MHIGALSRIALAISFVAAAPGEFTWVAGSKRPNTEGFYGPKEVYSAKYYAGTRFGTALALYTEKEILFFGGRGFGNSDVQPGFLGDLWKFGYENFTFVKYSFMSGVSGIDIYPDFASPNVFESGGPGGREGASSFFDETRNNFYVFGGKAWDFGDGISYADADNRYRNDLWYYNIADAVWYWVSGDQLSDSAGVYTSTSNASPSSRAYACAAYDPVISTWYLYGGYGIDRIGRAPGNLADIWTFDTVTKLWRFTGGNANSNVFGIYNPANPRTKSPGARSGASCFITKQGVFGLFGGQGRAGPEYDDVGLLNDYWEYNPVENPYWEWVTGPNRINAPPVYGSVRQSSTTYTPGGRARMAHAYDINNDLLYVYGGYAGESFGKDVVYSDLWAFNRKNKEWAFIGGSNRTYTRGEYGKIGVSSPANFPGGRHSMSMTYSPKQGVLFLMGGFGYGDFDNVLGHVGDIWIYETSSSSIESLESTGGIDVRTTLIIIVSIFGGALVLLIPVIFIYVPYRNKKLDEDRKLKHEKELEEAKVQREKREEEREKRHSSKKASDKKSTEKNQIPKPVKPVAIAPTSDEEEYLAPKKKQVIAEDDEFEVVYEKKPQLAVADNSAIKAAPAIQKQEEEISEHPSTKTITKHLFKTYKGILVAGFKQYNSEMDYKKGAELQKGCRDTWTLYEVELQSPELIEKYGGPKALLKVYADSLDKVESQKSQKEMFEQEAALLWLFKEKDHFVKTIGYSATPLGLLLKYYPEGTLKSFLYSASGTTTKITKRSSLSILSSLSSALSLMHSAELCHSDLKPSSILVEVENSCVTASLQNLEVSQILTHKIFPGRRFHRTHIQYDYLQYAAPETISRFRKKKVNLGTVEEFLKGDVFSIAMLIYELLHLQTPWSLNTTTTTTTTKEETSNPIVPSTSMKQQELTQIVEQELKYATQSD